MLNSAVNKNMDINSEMMKKALCLAQKAFLKDEVPVGAVIVKGNKIIGEGYNRREELTNSLAHAEIIAINRACEVLGSWRLDGCTLYVTLEPCPMCTGAVINSRIDTVVYGAYDEKGGCMGSLTDLTDFPFNHKVQVVGGYMEKECRHILESFFKVKRATKTEQSL